MPLCLSVSTFLYVDFIRYNVGENTFNRNYQFHFSDIEENEIKDIQVVVPERFRLFGCTWY